MTETVDAGLLGEMIIPSLRHAWNTFLQPTTQTNGHVTNCHVIPCGATVYACPVECSEIRRLSKSVKLIDINCYHFSYEYVFTLPVLVNSKPFFFNVYCIIFRLVNPQFLSLTNGLHIIGSCKFNDAQTSLVEEPYTCERLSLIRGSFKYLSSPQVALSFNFSDPQVYITNNISLIMHCCFLYIINSPIFFLFLCHLCNGMCQSALP